MGGVRLQGNRPYRPGGWTLKMRDLRIIAKCGVGVVAAFCLLFCFAACGQEVQQKEMGPVLKLTSSSFVADGDIPVKYSCDGANVSPALAWTDAPSATRSFALIMDDPDTPKGAVTHWLIYDLAV